MLYKFKPKFIYSYKFLNWLDFSGMALFPVIILKNRNLKTNKILINHEKIHFVQQLELALVFFYLLYFLNYLINLIIYKKSYLAYENICFEREAYTMEKDLDYLKHRHFFSWTKFIFKNSNTL